MSLINEALKKAQRQRETAAATPPTPGAPPPPPPPASPPSAPPAPAPHPGSRPGSGNKAFTLLIIGGLVIISLSVTATVYFLRGDRGADAVASLPPAPAPSLPSAGPAPAPSLATPVAAPQVSLPEPGVAAPPATVLPTPSAHPTPAQGVAASGEAAGSSGITPSPGPVVRIPALEPSAPKAALRIQAMITKLRITGIRLSATDSKVILNDQLFRVNDLIEPSLGLRLVKIESNLLTFTDGEGNTYVKHF